MHNSFTFQQYVCYTTLLNMFRAARCSSSGGPIVSPQPLVSSPSVNSRTVCRWRADCSPLSVQYAPLCNLFPHFLINGTIFEEKLLNTKWVFWFSLQRLSETFPILRRNARDMIKMYTGLHVKYPLFLSDFNDTSVSRKIFEKSPNIKFHENSSIGSRVVPCGRTVITKLIDVFCERV